MNADALSPARLAIYDLLIPKTDAAEVLRTQGGDLTPEAIRYYTFVATGDAKAADVAYSRAKLAEMERKARAGGKA